MQFNGVPFLKKRCMGDCLLGGLLNFFPYLFALQSPSLSLCWHVCVLTSHIDPVGLVYPAHKNQNGVLSIPCHKPKGVGLRSGIKHKKTENKIHKFRAQPVGI